jgi:hypothetical protein
VTKERKFATYSTGNRQEVPSVEFNEAMAFNLTILILSYFDTFSGFISRGILFEKMTTYVMLLP